MTDKLYKIINKEDQLMNWVQDVTRTRAFDVSNFTDLQANTARILPVPASSTDIKGYEKAGDIAVDASYIYYVTTTGGALVWRRISSSTF